MRIRLPDGDEIEADSADVHALLSQLTGVDVTFEPRGPASDTDFYRRYNAGGDQWLKDLAATFARQTDEPLPDFSQLPRPPMVEFVAAPGSFQPEAPLHLITTASLRQFKAWNAVSDWDVRRFRPNFVIETEPGFEGLIEQYWIASGYRCAERPFTVPPRRLVAARSRARKTNGKFDTSMVRTVVRRADQNCRGVLHCNTRQHQRRRCA